MIKKFKKAVISSILAVLVIFGAVMPMASAATAPNSGTRQSGFEDAFSVDSSVNPGSISVYDIDYDITKVELYDASNNVIRTATNSNNVVTSNSVTSGQTLTNVTFNNVATGQYTVAVFAESIKSAIQYVRVELKKPTITTSWSVAHKGTVTITGLNYDPLSPTKVSLLNIPFYYDNVISSAIDVDATGKAVFTDIPDGTNFTVKEEYTALGNNDFTGYFGNKYNWCYRYYTYVGLNSQDELQIMTNDKGDVTVNNAVYNAEVRLFHLPISTTNDNDTVTGNVYLSAIAPLDGIVSFPMAATEVGNYKVLEIGNASSDREAYFTIEPKLAATPAAPTLTLSSNGTGVAVTGALPYAKISIYNSSVDYNYCNEADAQGNVVFDQIYAGIYTATQSPQNDSRVPSADSNAITVQKWMSHSLNPGWNTISVPFALQNATFEAILGNQIGALDKAYAYDPTTTDKWVTLTKGVDGNQSQYLSKPMTALYVYINGTDEVRADFAATSSINPPSALQISTGWNLVGPSLLNVAGTPKQFLVGNLTDVIPMLVSPNGDGFVYTGNNNNNNPSILSRNNNYVVNTLGYWVYAKSATNLIGQISTGTVSNDYDIDDWTYNND
jgi:hypothetical protein